MKKVLILSKHIGLSGVTIHTLTLSKYLRKLGYEVYVTSSGGYYLEEFKKLSIPHHCINFDNKAAFFLNIIKLFILVKKIRPDILHCQWQINNYYAYIISKLFKIPFVSVLHLSDIKMDIFRKYSPWGNMSVAISRETFKELTEKYKVNQERLILIYNGVDLEIFKPSKLNERIKARKKFKISPGTVSISMIARLTEVKGAKYLIEAVKGLKDRYNIKLLFAGDGHLRKDLELLVKKFKIDAEFLGWTRNVREVLCASDIFVLPSIQEGFPLSVIEAMAMKVPVIRTKTAGAFDQIKNNDNGILINPGSSEELKNAIIKLIEDNKFKELIIENAFYSVVHEFSANVMTQRYIKEYQKLINGSKLK